MPTFPTSSNAIAETFRNTQGTEEYYQSRIQIAHHKLMDELCDLTTTASIDAFAAVLAQITEELPQLRAVVVRNRRR